MFASTISDQELIEKIRSGGTEKDRAIAHLYKKYRSMISRFVYQNKGSEEDAKDIFQEGIIIFYRHVLEKRFRADSSIRVYLYSICRRMWMDRLRKEKMKMNLIKDISAYAELEAFLPEPVEKKSLRAGIQQLLNQIGNSCKDLLVKTFYDNCSIKELVEITGFKNEQNVRNKKSKCLKQVKELLTKNPMLRASLRDAFDNDSDGALS